MMKYVFQAQKQINKIFSERYGEPQIEFSFPHDSRVNDNYARWSFIVAIVSHLCHNRPESLNPLIVLSPSALDFLAL